MARKPDAIKVVNVAVVGLSGMERDKGQAGVGKSCLCNRFIRSLADDYSVDHISVLSQTDFSGRVVNNDHFLYWGDVMKSSEEGCEFMFQVIEQTEFIDDASFQPFKGGKMEPYVKRCAATKITSAEKLMYICKNQLGIEKEYEQKVLPDGKLNIDGFLCVFDVSVVPSRTLERQTDHVVSILNNLVKTKKPVVLVTTKNDDSNDAYVREAEKIIQRKEYKGTIALVETSSHDNVNVDLAFVLLAQMIDRSKLRSKVLPYTEAARLRKELLDASTEAFTRLVRTHVTDYRALWTHTAKKLSVHKDWVSFVDLYGGEGSQRLFRRHIKRLRDEQLACRLQRHLKTLAEVLQDMVPDVNTLTENDWPSIQQYLKGHVDFSQYFYECPDDLLWTDVDLSDSEESRIPFEVLDTPEADNVFKNHVNALQQEQKRLEWKKQFKQLLEDTGYVTPGKHLSEVRVLFMGHECFEALSEHDCQQIYDNHQRELVEAAKHNFQELLLEHADLFYHFKSIVPSGTITQEDIKEITDVLQDDFRYKLLDRLDQDRKLMLFQHLGFVHCPIREHCPAFPNCMDALIERILGTKAHRPSSWNNSTQFLLNSDNNQLNLVLLGTDNLAEELAERIRAHCPDDELELDCRLYSLDYRLISGDVGLPQNSFKTADFSPHGSFCVYSNQSTFEYVRESLEKTLLANLEQDDKLPFQGLPIVLMFLQDACIDDQELQRLREEGQSLADSLQCPYLDMSNEDTRPEELVAQAMQQLVQSIHHRAGFLSVQQAVVECCEPDIRIIMCMFCGDPYSVENILSPLLSHQCCFLSGDSSIILETFLGDSKRKVEVIISSFHGANAFREELVHGFVLLYSTKRKASLATLNAFSMNIPNLPIQIMAVTDSGGANAFFNSDLSHLLITEGNATADRLRAHFMTSTSSKQQKTAFYTPFFKEVWEKKPEIEQAFHMEEPITLDSGEGTLEHPLHPLPPPRHESYLLKRNDGSGSENYEHVPSHSLDSLNGPDEQPSSSDHSDKYSHIYMYGHQNGDDRSSALHQADVSGSQESLATHDSGWVDDSVFAQRVEGQAHGGQGGPGWSNSYSHHAFTTGRRHMPMSKTRPKGNSQTLKQQPGKLNLKNFSIVTEAIARMNVGSKETSKSSTSFGHAPLAAPEDDGDELTLEHSKVMDKIPGMFHRDDDYMFTLVQDAVSTKSKLRQRREKGQPCYPVPVKQCENKSYSDTDSEWSSLERRQRAAEVYCKVNRKPAAHKRVRKKRAIPVQPPRVPVLGSHTAGQYDPPRGAFVAPPELPPSYLLAREATESAEVVEKEASESNSDNSDASDRQRIASKRTFSLKNKSGPGGIDVSSKMVVPVPSDLRVATINSPNLSHAYSDLFVGKLNCYGNVHDEESSFDVSSPRDNNSPMFGVVPKLKDGDREKLTRKKEKQKAKDDEKQEKRRVKEEKLRKLADKEKEREKKKQKQKQKSISVVQAPLLSDFAQSENNFIPLFLDKCVAFIEAEGLDSEGLYRVPGNRSHVDLLFQKFEEDASISITQLDIPVNAVATALKDFFSKHLPPLLDTEVMSELEEIAGARGSKPLASSVSMEVKTDRSCRLLALRGLLNKLPVVNFAVLKFIFQHFVRVSDNSKLNSMDSKNLAICWWPTLLPIEFSDMGRFEQTRPYLEDAVQTMIDQFPFLFCGKEAFVMV